MANSIGFLNEGFKKYECIKPSFEDELYEAMKSLTEKQQEWSDEDKHDNEILWGIRDKWQKRTNAKLTPEEKDILKKYNIAEPMKDGEGNPVVRVNDLEPQLYDIDKDLFTKTKYPKYGRPYEGASKDINVADRARKLPVRAKDKRIASWNNDDREWQYHDKIDQYDADYRDMKHALRDKEYAKDELAKLDAGTSFRDDRIKKAQRELDDAIKSKEWSYDYNRKEIDRQDKKINKLLKRESLSKKRMNEGYFNSYDEVIADIADRAKSYVEENPDWDMTDCIFTAIDDGLIYTDDQWIVLRELGDKDPIELLSDYAWERFYNDVMVEMGELDKIDESFIKNNRKSLKEQLNFDEWEVKKQYYNLVNKMVKSMCSEIEQEEYSSLTNKDKEDLFLEALDYVIGEGEYIIFLHFMQAYGLSLPEIEGKACANSFETEVLEKFDDVCKKGELDKIDESLMNEEVVECPNCGTSFDTDDANDDFIYSGDIDLTTSGGDLYALSSEFSDVPMLKEEIMDCSSKDELLQVVNKYDEFKHKWTISSDNRRYTRLSKKGSFGNVFYLIVYKNK